MHENDQHEEEYLKEMAPILFGKKHEPRQDAPEGYFEALPEKVLQRVAAEKRPKGRIIQLINFRNLAIAAGLALVLAGLSFLQHYAEKGNTTQSQYSTIDIDYNDETTIDVLAEMIDSDIIYASIESDDHYAWKYAETVDDQDIVDFISDEGLSEEVLYDTNY